MPFLKKLNIGKRGQKEQITDAGMVHLAQIKSLEKLILPRGITGKGMAHIAKLTNLKYLWGGDSDTALQHISKLHSLEFLLTGGSDITSRGLANLSTLTNLKELNLSGDSITNEGLANLKTLKKLERLSLRCKNITLSGLSHLNALKKLSYLWITGVKQDGSGLDISGLQQLETLSLTPSWSRKEGKSVNDPIRDEDMAFLAKMKNLRELSIGGIAHSQITDAGVAYLKDLPKILSLLCGSPYLTDKSLATIGNMKTLNYSLTITGNFTDDGLRYLEGLKDLHRLKINTTNNFSSAALERLQDNLPRLVSLTVDQDRELGVRGDTKPALVEDHPVAPDFSFKTLDGNEVSLGRDSS